MRGHGQTDSPKDSYAYSEDLTVGDMDALLNACGVQQAIIGGHSLGGYMSMAYHVLHADRTKALMLFDTGPGYKKDEARAGWNKRAEATAREYEKKACRAGRSAEVLASNHSSAEGLARVTRHAAQRDARVMIP
jgi:pimeloyl-ACP methyl ester carboxylesterase